MRKQDEFEIKHPYLPIKLSVIVEGYDCDEIFFDLYHNDKLVRYSSKLYDDVYGIIQNEFIANRQAEADYHRMIMEAV